MNPSLAPTPTTSPATRILAIGRFDVPPTPEQLQSIRPREVPATVRLYLDGKIDQWYSRKDAPGVVFLMNVQTPHEAHALLEKLPFGVAGLMQFELIPLGPLAPLEVLLAQHAQNGTGPVSNGAL